MLFNNNYVIVKPLSSRHIGSQFLAGCEIMILHETSSMYCGNTLSLIVIMLQGDGGHGVTRPRVVVCY